MPIFICSPDCPVSLLGLPAQRASLDRCRLAD
jgi:hypothetical protein